MRRMNVPAYCGRLSFSMFLIVSMACWQPLQAQDAPSTDTSIVVRMIDAVDSASNPAGKQYRASVTTAVDAGNNGSCGYCGFKVVETGWKNTSRCAIPLAGLLIPEACTPALHTQTQAAPLLATAN